jgi:hypothetical protein
MWLFFFGKKATCGFFAKEKKPHAAFFLWHNIQYVAFSDSFFPLLIT